ncbi:MAG: thiamine phosphate synthase, partial [Candidatus Binataceae bacterium]
MVEAALNAASTVAPLGTIAIQLREKDMAARDLYDLACGLLPLCHLHSAPLLINDRTDVALAAGASGVHLPSGGMPIADARGFLGPSRLIGVSTHSASEVSAAASGGADFAVYGPVFDPLSKAAYGAARGAEGLA